jgi:hypothetical protein
MHHCEVLMQSITVIMMLNDQFAFAVACAFLCCTARVPKNSIIVGFVCCSISHSNQSATYKQECTRVAQEVRRCSQWKGVRACGLFNPHHNIITTYNLAAASLLCVCNWPLQRAAWISWSAHRRTVQQPPKSVADKILSRIPETH